MIWACLLSLPFMLPGAAMAVTAYVEPGGANVRVGPGTSFPVVVTLGAGVRVNIKGCLANRNWCQLRTRGRDGWIAASRLNFVYRGRRVLLPRYFTYFGAPVVVFR
jgi:uncharacterized protein YraI